MASLIPERFREWATTAYLFEPISHYAALATASNDDTSLRAEWPQELAVKYGGSGYLDTQCLGAWQDISRASIVAVIETVRNKLLDFVLEVEAENPDAGEASPDVQPVSPEKIQQLVNNYFAPVGNVAQHSQGFSQTANVGISTQDLTKLVAELSTHLDELDLVPDQRLKAKSQIATLKAQLESEPDPVIVEQAGRTLRNILEGTVASLLATAAKPTVWHAIQGLLALFPR